MRHLLAALFLLLFVTAALAETPNALLTRARAGDPDAQWRLAGKLMLGDTTGFRSCTPAGIQELLIRSGVPTDGAEVVILGASRAKVRGGKPIFGRTVDYVLRNAPTRVAVIAGRRAA